MFKEELISILHNLFQKTEEEKWLLIHSFYELILSWCQKQQKRYKKKRELYTNSTLMNRGIKKSNKMLANRIQIHIKGILYHNQMMFIPGVQGWSIFEDQAM